MITSIIIFLLILMLVVCCAVFSIFASLLFWLLVKIPLGILLLVTGFALCCTLLLIPIGAPIAKKGVQLIVPGI